MITIYKDIKDTKNFHYITVEKALQRIKYGNSKPKVYIVRGSKDKKERARVKATLPSVCFSGKFTDRKDECLIEHSGFVILDFDNIKNVQKRKDEIIKDEYIYACWVSPSGNGLKALVKIPKEPQNHEAYYLALLERYPELDSTSKNLSRVCYESYDEQIYINEKSKVWQQKSVSAEVEKKQKTEAPKIENKKTNYKKVDDVLNIIRNSVDGKKHESLLKACRLAGGFINGGEVDEQTIIKLITDEILAKGVDDVEQTKKTIQDGIQNGKNEPIIDLLSTSNGDFSILSSKEKESEWINLAEQNKIPQGYDIGSEHFDAHYRLKSKTLTGWFGIDNVGKTTFFLFLACCYAKKHGINWLLLCRENQPAAVRQKLIELFIGEPLHKATRLEIKNAKEFVYNHFDILDDEFNLDMDNFFDVMKKCYSKKHYYGTFLDPYNSIQFEQTPKSNYHFLGRLREFQNLYDMSFHLSMHISTEKARNYTYNDKDILMDFSNNIISVKDQPKIPRKNFVEGGQPVANKLDDIVIVHRIFKVQELRNYTLVSVDKVKEEQTGGMVSFIEPIMFKKSDTHVTFIDKHFKSPLDIKEHQNKLDFKPIEPNRDFESEGGKKVFHEITDDWDFIENKKDEAPF